jgi:phage N-6-adenine-methyltransferase
MNSDPNLSTKTGASLNRHNSETSVGTPQAFVDACARRYGSICIDLAADDQNTKCNRFLSEREDSLKQDWAGCIHVAHSQSQKSLGIEGTTAWLNPPYDDIGKWAKKADESRARVIMLVPASVGTNWFRDYVHLKHPVDVLNGRIQFDGHTQPYPKDLMLCLFGFARQLRRVTLDVWTPEPACLGRKLRV